MSIEELVLQLNIHCIRYIQVFLPMSIYRAKDFKLIIDNLQLLNIIIPYPLQQQVHEYPRFILDTKRITSWDRLHWDSVFLGLYSHVHEIGNFSSTLFKPGNITKNDTHILLVKDTDGYVMGSTFTEVSDLSGEFLINR